METDKCIEILEQAGVKPTSVRILVYKAIMEMEESFSLADLEMKLLSADRSSIFRAITLFSQHHLIHSFEDGSGSLKYCMCHNHGHCRPDEWHCHFYCEKCKKTYCLEDDAIPLVSLPEGFVAHQLNYIIKGVCRNCSMQRL